MPASRRSRPALPWRRGQVGEARRTREATIRPFVVGDLDVDRPPLVLLSIANIGHVMARSVRFSFDPPIASSFDERGGQRFGELQMFAEGIDHLAPGKVIEQKFDYAHGRWNADGTPKREYSDRYEVIVDYGSRSKTTIAASRRSLRSTSASTASSG